MATDTSNLLDLVTKLHPKMDFGMVDQRMDHNQRIAFPVSTVSQQMVSVVWCPVEITMHHWISAVTYFPSVLRLRILKDKLLISIWRILPIMLGTLFSIYVPMEKILVRNAFMETSFYLWRM